MATKTADIHIRIQPEVKEQAEAIFARAGVSASDAIEQFYLWTIRHQKTPMRLKSRRANIPDLNEMTDDEIDAMIEDARRDVREGKIISNEEAQAALKNHIERRRLELERV